jgi:cytosine/adenosine deaminase-related metal-dependent hydrolase
MTSIYCARWIVPVSRPPLSDAAIAIDNEKIISIGNREDVFAAFSQASIKEFGDCAIIPGLVNAHSHLELTVMRGFLESVEADFFAWLRKLTVARLERLTTDDLYVSAAWGACEAARSGVTCFADASDSAATSMRALRDIGLRGIVFQESFGPDPRLAQENFELLKKKVGQLLQLETSLVRCGVSPHAPYTVCTPQLELISHFALEEQLPVTMHAAETKMEKSFMHHGEGAFADGLRKRGIEWSAPRVSTIKYLSDHGVLKTRPLLAHCINVDDEDLQLIKDNGASIAHCPKSNAKLGHGVAPFEKFRQHNVTVGLGSDSVASNNTCDILEEARFALLMARATDDSACSITADDVLRTATAGGAQALGLNDQIGELKEGLQADFAVVSLSGVHQTPTYDVADALIFSSSGRDVVLTVVAGREVFKDGTVQTVDENQLREKMEQIAARLAA